MLASRGNPFTIQRLESQVKSILRLRVIAAGSLLMLLAGSCVYKKLIFNNLDWLVVYQLDSYFDLTTAQEKQIKIPVHETVTWLKAERLPLIISLLRDIQATAETRKIEAESYDRWTGQVGVWRQELTERMAPPLGHLFKQMDADQMQHLEAKLAKGDRNLVRLLERSESEFPEEFADYVDEATSGLKFWVGKLHKPQKQLLVEKLGWNRAVLSEQLKQRRRSRDYWLTVFKKQDLAELTAAIKASSGSEGGWSDLEYRKFRQDGRDRWRTALLALFVSLDQDQWQHLDKVLLDLVFDLEKLNNSQLKNEKRPS